MPDPTDNLPSDERLVAAVGTGDADALRLLVERYQDRLRRFAANTLRDGHAADDVVQDAFVRAWLAARRFEAVGSVAGWLYRITANLCRDRLRKLTRRVLSLDQLNGPPVAADRPDPIGVDETAAEIRRAVDDLPERQRTALLLHRYEQLTHRQIAEITGWSRSAVESLLVRAYGRLRQRLGHLVRS